MSFHCERRLPIAFPTKIPVFQAQCRLYPPHSPTTSSISPAKYRLGQISDSHVSGLISVSGMPPFVACALFHARCLEGEIGNRFNPFVMNRMSDSDKSEILAYRWDKEHKCFNKKSASRLFNMPTRKLISSLS